MMSYSVAQPVETVQGDHSYEDVRLAASIQGAGGNAGRSVMLGVLHASHAEFRSGWFVESLAAQTLVVFVIRTRRVPFFRSRPSVHMIITPVACAVVGALLPFSPLAHFLGFTILPFSFFPSFSG
jgi:hypothetical protein